MRMIGTTTSSGTGTTVVVLLLLCCLLLVQPIVGEEWDFIDYFGGLELNEPYMTWYDTKEISTRYPARVYIPSDKDFNQGAAIHWTIDDEFVYVAVAARATGWIGFGIAEAGGMLGADMALFTATRPTEIVDAHTLEGRYPLRDDCQNWEWIDSHIDTEGGFLMFEGRRKLDTNDPQDHIIINDEFSSVPEHRIIAAWGDTVEVGYHGDNRARGTARFFGSGRNAHEIFRDQMDEEADGYFVVRARNHTIEAEETHYAYYCLGRDDMIAQGVPNTTDLLDVIGFEPFVSEGTSQYVHHYLITVSTDGDSCAEAEAFGGYTEVAYVWAPGQEPFSFPSNIGSPLFGSDGFQAFTIGIHYNNPSLDKNMVDNSGIKVYWTSTPREHRVGVFRLGDPGIRLRGTPVGTGTSDMSVHEFTCRGECSTAALDEPVNVIRELIHMHDTGVRAVNEQIRNDEIIRSSSIDVWDFNAQGNIPIVQQPFTIEPGDSFRTKCYYRDRITTNGTGTVFGLGSEDEMCIAFLYYYPRKTISVIGREYEWLCGAGLGKIACGAQHEIFGIDTVEELGRYFGPKPSADQCPAIATDDPTASPVAVVLNPTDTPVVPATDAPVVPPTDAPVVPPTDSPVVPQVNPTEPPVVVASPTGSNPVTESNSFRLLTVILGPVLGFMALVVAVCALKRTTTLEKMTTTLEKKEEP